MGKSLNNKELGKGITQEKNGKYLVQITYKGKSIKKRFNTLSEAKRWQSDTLYNLIYNNPSMPTDMLFDSWYDYWINTIKGDNITYKTRECYIGLYNSFIKPYIGDIPIKDIRPMHCMNILVNMGQQGYCSSTIAKVRTNLHDCFEMAVDNDIIIKNPITKSVTVKGKKSKERYVMDRAEEDTFIKYLADYNAFNPLCFILQTGLRYGELVGLKWTDIDMDNKFFKIQRSLTYRKDLGRFIEKPPKSKAGYRTVPLSDKAIDILKSQKKHNSMIPVSVMEYKDYVFLNDSGYPVDKSNLNRAIRSIYHKMNLPPISIHSLRHTFATRCIEAGMRPKTLQKIIGHSTITLTMDLYVHVTDTEMFKEFKKFELLKSGTMD